METQKTVSHQKSPERGDTPEQTVARERLAALIVRVASGDEAAMEEVYRHTSVKIYSLLVQMLPDRPTADEVLQEAYLAIWRRADSFSMSRASPMTWIITIARNKAIDRLRSERHSRRNDALDALPVDPVDQQPSALELMETSDDHKRLHSCLDQLDSHQRQAIRTAFFAGETYDELARRSHVPLGTMKSWIRRGLLQLKTCLET